ncbi:hypothetical protein BJY00DRAFT_206189 [Aspergillus carlsbadensis]|nr:hypothetical protein BJY00DRAFT_206189 [Aspergillus carlsbadensis]
MPLPTQPTRRRRFSPQWGKQLGFRAFLIFQRLHRFYTTFVILAALMSGLALATLTFDEFHPPDSTLIRAAEGFLASSAATAVISAVTATELLFHFEGLEKATRLDLAFAWLPLVLLDLSIVEFLVGLVCWYYGKSDRWRGTLMVAQFSSLLGGCIIVTIWIWFQMKEEGGLGKEETKGSANSTYVADE